MGSVVNANESGRPSRPARNFATKYAALVRETSVAGWDDGDAAPIPEKRWRDFVLPLAEQSRQCIVVVPEPHPSASADGTMYLRWATGRRLLDVEVTPEGEILWTRSIDDRVESGTLAHRDELTRLLLNTFGV